jgi:hypothetical protein
LEEGNGPVVRQTTQRQEGRKDERKFAIKNEWMNGWMIA